MDCLDFLCDAMIFMWEKKKKKNSKPNRVNMRKPFQQTVALQGYVNRKEHVEEHI